MLIYHLNNALLLVWSFLFFGLRKPNKKLKLLFLFVCFLQLLLIALFRNDLGFDYQMYTEGFYRMGMEGFSNLSYLDWEIGFVLFTKVIVFFTKNHVIYLAIISAICFACTGWFIYKFSKKIWLSVILYVNLYFFFLSMNFLRQSIAISITLFAWQFLQKKKFLPYLVIIIIAALFHTTALIMIPVYFIVKIKPSTLLALLYCYALLFFYISSEGFLRLITNFFHQEYQSSVFLSQGISLIYAVFPMIILVLSMILKNRLIEKKASNQYLISLAFLSVFLMIIMSRHAILERFSYYSYIYFILLIPEIISLFEKRAPVSFTGRKAIPAKQAASYQLKCKLLVLGSILVVSYGLLLVGMFDNVHGVIPYQSWISPIFIQSI